MDANELFAELEQEIRAIGDRRHRPGHVLDQILNWTIANRDEPYEIVRAVATRAVSRFLCYDLPCNPKYRQHLENQLQVLAVSAVVQILNPDDGGL